MLSCIPIGWISLDLIFTKYHQTFAPTATDKEHTTGATSLSSCASASGTRRMGNHRIILVIFLCALFNLPTANATPPTPPDGYRIVHVYTHDSNAFTQGLVYLDGKLYESTGRNGQSSLRMVDPSSG